MKWRILLLSASPEPGKLRALILRQAGYEVQWPGNKAETEALLDKESFDVLLIGHTIPGQSARGFADTFRARNPDGKVIAIMAGAYVLVKADKTVKAIDGPEALLEALNQLLGASRPGSIGGALSLVIAIASEFLFASCALTSLE